MFAEYDVSLFEELKRRNVFRVATAYLVVGWLLTEVLTTVLETLGTPGWAPRLVVLIFAFGFIPTVILSWVFELTPEGLKRDHEIDRKSAEQRRYGSRLDYLTVGGVIVLVLFLAFFGATRGPDERSATALPVSSASVAVLPFVNLSNDEDNEYFSDGLTETLLHMLAQVPDLKVAARTSSFAFKGENKPIGEIASALGVAHVLEGSVQRSGDRVRITAQLIRADDGFHIWSEVYDRTLDDIFGIQDEIAGKVGGALSASLLGTPSGGAIAGVTTLNPDAYDIYLQALNERATFSYGGLQAAEDLLKGALAIDPDFIDAKAELANNYLAQVETGLMPDDSAYQAVAALTEQVLEVQPQHVRARALQLYAETMVAVKQGELTAIEDAISRFEELVAEDPADFATRVLLIRMLGGQDNDRLMETLSAALEIDPLNPRIHYEFGAAYLMLDEWEKARSALKKSLELEPAQPNAYVHLGMIGQQIGDGLEYIQQFLNAVEVDPMDHELPGMIAYFLYELGLVEEGDDFRNRVMAIAPTSEVAYQLNLVRAINAGDEEAAVAAARRAIEDEVPDRRNAWVGAVQHLLRVAASRGTVEQEMAYLDANAPGILDFEADSVPMRYRQAQLAAFDAWYTILPQEEISRRLEFAMTIAESLGMDPKNSPNVQLAVAALQGRTEDAVEVALDNIFEEPVTVNFGWRRTFSQAQYADFVLDPRVQAAMQRWEQQEAELRDEIRMYLADLQAST
jgi:TolB-like protein/tetratricopeptide (TPR) repeat protein